MTRPVAMLIVGRTRDKDRVVWNQVADVRLLMLIDELRDEVAASINAELCGRTAIEAEALDEDSDYGTRHAA